MDDAVFKAGIVQRARQSVELESSTSVLRKSSVRATGIPMFSEISRAYLACLRDAWPLMLVAAIAGIAALAAWQELERRDVEGHRLRIAQWAALVVALVLGTTLVVARASVFDDAFISFRFVRNLLEGHGLVWNIGERVEGYTNFLWVLIVAAGSFVSGVQPAEVGLWASIAVFPCSLLIVFQIERTLGATRRSMHGQSRAFPIATLLLMLQDSFVTAGSSGLETGFAALLVCAGLLSMLTARSALTWFRTGLLLILASLTRPDHTIFYATASAVLAWEQGVLVVRLGRPALRDALRCVLAFSAPFLLYLAHTAWRFSYYGQLFPNTYYAKAAAGSHYSQGAVYATTFYLASHLWIVLPLVVIWLLRATPDLAMARFKLFFGLSFVLFNAYVLKVGGDFMFGRFYVSLLPMLLIALGQITSELLHSARAWRGYALGALIGSTAGGVHIITPGLVVWGVCDEHTLYSVKRWHPLVIDASNFRVGKTLEQWRAAGVKLRIATSGIGMVGYYSRTEVIDLLGLTDAHVAHEPIVHRGRPGHEKHASAAYIRKRNPDFVRANYHLPQYEKLTRFRFGASVTNRPWYIYRYDRARMDAIAKLSPKARFIRFPDHLKRYIKRDVRKKPIAEIDRDVAFFKRYYFDQNEDPKLLEKLLTAVAKRRAR